MANTEQTQTQKVQDPDAGKVNNRRLILINPRFQLIFLGYMVAVSAVAITIFYFANLYFFAEFTKTGQALGLPPEHVFFQFINNQRHTMNGIFALTASVCFIALTVGGLAFSHRVAGPLYRLKRHMAAVAAGETTRDVKFRKKDFFPEVADTYNQQLHFLLGKRSGEEATDSVKRDSGKKAA